MKLSVIIPCRHGDPHVAQAIGSALEQDTRPAEIVLVTDVGRPLAVAGAAANGDEAGRGAVPIRIVSTRWLGLSQARNVGVASSAGDALLFLDPSDVLERGALSALEQTLQGGAEVALSVWSPLVHDGARWFASSVSRAADPEPDLLRSWWHGHDFPVSTQLWRRRALHRIGGWDERATWNADGDMVARALLGGLVLQVSPDARVYCRRPVLPTADEGMPRAHLESEIYVRLKTAYALRDRDLLARYRASVVAVFSELADICSPCYPDLADRCRQHARRFGQRRSLAARRIFGALDWRVHPVGHRRANRAAAPPQDADNFEVTCSVPLQLSRALPSAASTLAPPAAPMVSVVIPTYNRAHLIARALDSVLAQTWPDLEVVVVDDGSTDDTASVVHRYVQLDARVRYVRQHPNRGVGAARNLGMRESAGELIAFLDSDDYWFPHKLARQVELMQRAPADVGLVYCGVENVNERGDRWYYEPEHRGDVYAQLLAKNVVHSGSGVVIRRNVIRSAGFFDEQIPANEDYDYWLRIARSYRFDYVREPLLRYFDLSGTARKSNDVQANMDARAWIFRKYEAEMRWAGAAHRFLLTSAKWHVVPWYDNKWGARRLAFRAVLINPRAWEAWRFLLRHVSPEPLRQLLRPLRRARYLDRSGQIAR